MFHVNTTGGWKKLKTETCEGERCERLPPALSYNVRKRMHVSREYNTGVAYCVCQIS